MQIKTDKCGSGTGYVEVEECMCNRIFSAQGPPPTTTCPPPPPTQTNMSQLVYYTSNQINFPWQPFPHPYPFFLLPIHFLSIFSLLLFRLPSTVVPSRESLHPFYSTSLSYNHIDWPQRVNWCKLHLQFNE